MSPLVDASRRGGAVAFAIVAYRGGVGEGPENALSTCQKTALACPDAWLEVDVRSTADGVAVLMHDASLDRTTDHRGPVAAVTAKALSEVRLAGTDEAPPTLASLMEAVSSRLVLDVRTRDPRALGTIAAYARSHAERIVLVSEQEGVLRRLVAEAPGVRIGGSRHRTIRALLGLPAQAHLWMVPERLGPLPLVTAGLVDRMGRRDSAVWVWVVDDVEQARRLREWGVAGVFTTVPTAMTAALV